MKTTRSGKINQIDNKPNIVENNPSKPYRLGYGSITSFQKDPSQFLTDLINRYLDTAATNWAVPFQHQFFSAPVAIAFGDGDSQAFMNIKKKYPWTLTPRECLEKPPAVQVSTVNGIPKSKIESPARDHLPVITESGKITWPKGEPPLPPWQAKSTPPGSVLSGLKDGYGEASAARNTQTQNQIDSVTCISIGLPIHKTTLKSEASYPWGNSPELKVNSLIGSHLGFIADVSFYVVNVLQMLGYRAIAPTFTNWGQEFLMDYQYEGATSRATISPSPEREWAVAAGLGTYGLPDMIISERGMAINLTTVITSAKFPPTPKPDKEYCLFYRDGSCKECIKRCPGQAISATISPPGRLAAKCHGGGLAAANYNITYLKEKMIKELGDYVNISGNLMFGGSGPGKSVLGFPACGRCYTGVPCATGIPD
jgi:hypothetical protein